MQRNLLSMFNTVDQSHCPIYDFALMNDSGTPYVIGVLTRIKGEKRWISTENIDWTQLPVHFPCATPWESLPPGAFSIKKQLLWRIGLSLKHQRPVRVVNYELKQEQNQLRLHKLFFGWKGLMSYFTGHRIGKRPIDFLTWDQYQPFFESACLSNYDKMDWFYPADIADMLRMLPFHNQVQLINGLHPMLAANTMKELEAHFQHPILDKLSSGKISELLSLLPSNHASAILREYKDPEKLVQLIPNPLQNKIRTQLGYDPGSAGAWMDTEFFSFSSKSTCSECLSYLRTHPLSPESVFYIYIENGRQEFIGVVSIRSVIMSDPDTPLETLMKKNLVALTVQTPKVDVANLMSRYHLLALPVVDNEKKITGVIKIYDVLDSTLEYPI